MFTNPYENLPEKEVNRTTIVVSSRDCAFINSLHGRRGTLQTTINLLLARTIEQLKKHGITEYDPDRYEQAVGAAVVTIGVTSTGLGSGGPATSVGSPIAHDEPHGEAPSGDDGRGVTSVARGTPRAPTQPPNPVSAGKRLVRRVRRK